MLPFVCVSLNFFPIQKIEIISSMCSDDNGLELETIHKGKTQKQSNTWRLNNMLLNNEWVNNEIIFCVCTQPFLWASWLPVVWTLHLICWLSLHHLVLFLKFWSVLSFGPYFFAWEHLLHCKGWSLMHWSGQGKPHCCVVALYVGQGVREGTVPLAWLWLYFQSLSPWPRSKLGPSGADSRVSGFVYVLRPCGSLQWTLLWA